MKDRKSKEILKTAKLYDETCSNKIPQIILNYSEFVIHVNNSHLNKFYLNDMVMNIPLIFLIKSF